MVPSIYIPGTKPHCLVSTEGNVNFLGTRNIVSVRSKKNHPKLRSLSGHASIILICMSLTFCQSMLSFGQK